MHDPVEAGRRTSRLTAFSLCILLLASIPFLFRKPLTTIRDPLSIAIHGYQLSLFDPVTNDRTSASGFPIQPRGGLALGTHCIWPVELTTARDTVSGNVLLMLSVPGGFEGVPPPAVWNGMEVSFAAFEGRLAVLVARGSGISWPEEAFRRISER